MEEEQAKKDWSHENARVEAMALLADMVPKEAELTPLIDRIVDASDTMSPLELWEALDSPRLLMTAASSQR